MRRFVLAMGISLLVAFFCFSCGGGGSEDSSVGNLQGTWLGVIEDDTGTLEEFSLQIDGSGNIIEVTIGKTSTGDTGHINEGWDENLFYVRYDSGGSGIMIVDDQYSHATYGDYGALGISDFYCGVLEKGATTLPPVPAFASSDIVGSYPVGGAYVFTYDSSAGEYDWEGEAISMTVNSDLTFSGSSETESFSGGFDALLRHPTYGGYAGTLTRDTTLPKTLDIKALVSPDKTYVAAYAKEIGTTPTSLDDFILIGLIK